MGDFRTLTIWRPLANSIANWALRRYYHTIAQTQIVNVCPQHFFATRYGLAAIMQKLFLADVSRKYTKVPLPSHYTVLELLTRLCLYRSSWNFHTMFRYRYPLSRPVKILVVIFLNFGLQNFCPIARRQASASGRSPPASTYTSRVRPRFSRTFDVRPQSRTLLPPSVPSLLSFLATSRTLATRRPTCPIDNPHTQICRNQRYPLDSDHAECLACLEMVFRPKQ